jgi:hypothetical protein
MAKGSPKPMKGMMKMPAAKKPMGKSKPPKMPAMGGAPGMPPMGGMPMMKKGK